MLATATKRPGERNRSAKPERPVAGGRPPKSDKGTADAQIGFRLRKEQREAMEQAAKRANQTLTEWVLNQLNAAAKRSSATARRPKKK